MKNPSVTTLKKYLAFLTKTKRKYVTAEYLSHEIGVYPEIIQENLEYFEPMIAMDPEYNLLELVPQMQEYVDNSGNKKQLIDPSIMVHKNEISPYESVTDFIYKKMSIGGIIDRGYELSDKDLRLLKKLINEELEKRKK